VIFVFIATASIAISFGIARYGFGLFLPDMTSDFSLSGVSTDGTKLA
jgi:hypothetical protein